MSRISTRFGTFKFDVCDLILHGMIRNEKSQHCSNIAALCCSISSSNRPVLYHLQVVLSRLSDGRDVAIAAHTVLEPGCPLGAYRHLQLHPF